MNYRNTIEVDGKVKATVQAEEQGDAILLNDELEVPGQFIPNLTLGFDIDSDAWTGYGPFEAEIIVPGVHLISTPIVAPDSPDELMREVIADAQITVVSVVGDVVKFVADGNSQPLVDIPAIAYGVKGIRSEKVISIFGSGGGGVDFHLNVMVTASAGTPDLSGILVTATPSTGSPLSGTTDANGLITFPVKQGMTYDVTLSKANFTITPSQTIVTIQDTSTLIEAIAYEAPKLNVVCTGSARAGRLVTATPSTGTPITGLTDANGRSTLTLQLGSYSVTVDYPSGQSVDPASSNVTATAGGVYEVNFAILERPILNVTVSDESHTGKQEGRLITATPSTGAPITAITDNQGKASLTLNHGVQYTLRTDAPSGFVVPEPQVFNVQAGQTYDKAFSIFEEARINVTVAPAAAREGRIITATSGSSVYTGTTDSLGTVSISVPAGTYTVTTDAPDGYFVPASQQVIAQIGQVHTVNFTIVARPRITVSVTPSVAASGLLVRAVGTQTFTAYTNSSGTASLTVDVDTYTVIVTAPAGYLPPASQEVVATAGGTYNRSFALQAKPRITVTVVDSSGAGHQSGRLITATDGSDVVTGTTNAAGTTTLMVNNVGQYAVSTNVPVGGTADTTTVNVAGDGTYNVSLTLTFGFKFTMAFNPTVFQTDPTGCLTYGDDATGFTPLQNQNTTLASITSYGSWDKATNKLLKKLYYATFNDDGTISQILNPDNLNIDEYGNPSDITEKSTMLVIPTLYSKREAGKITISDKEGEGTPFAHTIDGHVFDNLGIGVYLSASISGIGSSALFRSVSGRNASYGMNVVNVVNGTNWMMWNWHQYALYRDIVMFTMKSFDSQRKIGQGGHRSQSAIVNGYCNEMGMFAGNVSGQTTYVKALIENPWGVARTFLGDTITASGGVFAGQNSVPQNNSTNGKILIRNGTSSSFPTVIDQSDMAWGLGLNSNGNDAVGTCDTCSYSISSTSTMYRGMVGGQYALTTPVGQAGLFKFETPSGGTDMCSRLAFVFDN